MREGGILADKYRLVRRLGKGGEGSVYLAIHLQTEMFWAVKEIPLKQDAQGRYNCHELQMMKQLKMRHLPQIIDVIQSGESVFLVMEHVRGISLDVRIRDGKVLSYEEVMDTAEQVTEALCYLESRERPVCHLDIKPSNLIRRPDGLIKLVDFGSAWKEREQLMQTGTEGYAAPEQYQTGVKPDVRADIYALGASLYRMLSGRIWTSSPEHGSVPNCPQQMSDLILRCLREDPSERFQSAASLRKELSGIRTRERREKGRVRLLGALAMALPAAALCMRILPSAIDLSADESWNYEKLLREATVVSEEESREYYRKAVFMDSKRSEAYLKYLEDVCQDGIFSEEEERFLRDLLHSVRPGTDQTFEELLREEPQAYTASALQIGLSYWYQSPREDCRRIAMGWFEKTIEAADEAIEEQTKTEGDPLLTEEHKEMAGLYLQLGTVLEKMNVPAQEDTPGHAEEYWEDLGRILEVTKDGVRQDDPLTQMKFSLEALHTLTFLAGDLTRAGISREEQTDRIRELERRSREAAVSHDGHELYPELSEEIKEASDTAMDAVNRQSEAFWENTQTEGEQEGGI